MEGEAEVLPHNLHDVEEQRPVRQSLCSTIRRAVNWKCFILSVLISCCLSAIIWCRTTQVKKKIVNFSVFPITRTKHASPCEDGLLYVPVVLMSILYCLYLIECFQCTARMQMRQSVPSSEIATFIEAMRAAQPVTWWKAICYHYVRRTRHVTRYRNGDAYTSMQFFYERMNSQAAGGCFLYANCGVKDISKKLYDIGKFPTTKISGRIFAYATPKNWKTDPNIFSFRFSKGFAFLNIETANEFEDQRTRFFQENERRDDYMEMREGLDLTNIPFREFVIGHRDTQSSPWYTRHSVFWLASIFLLSWPLRLIIEYNTAYIHYQVTKLFGVNYVTPVSGGRLSRGSTTCESRELEMTIMNNCSLVPSYSEAVLMDQERMARDTNANLHHSVPNASSSYSVNSFRGFRTRGSRTSLPQLASLSRPTLHNGYVIYHPTPLLERTPGDPFHGRDLTTPTEAPPKYEDALKVSAPLLRVLTAPPLRRSLTERSFRASSRFFCPRRSCDHETEL